MIEIILAVFLLSVIGISLLLGIANQSVLSANPKIAGDVPYSFSVGTQNGSCNAEWERVNALAVPAAGVDSVNGVNDTQFTGLNLPSISFSVCGFSSVSGSSHDFNASDTTPFTIGVFSKTGTLVQSYGSSAWNTLTGHVAGMLANGTIVNDIKVFPLTVSFTGSHIMAKGEIVGITFSDSTHPPVGSGCGLNCNTPSHYVELMCGGPCLGNELPKGGVVDFASSTSNSPGFALAGTFGFSAISISITGLSDTISALEIFAVSVLVIFISKRIGEEF